MNASADGRFNLCCVNPLGVTDSALQLKVEAELDLSESRSQAWELLLSSQDPVDEHLVKEKLRALSLQHTTDIAVMRHSLIRQQIGLALFDMDSTLIQGEVIDEMAQRLGVGEQVKAITKRAMNGGMNFDQSLRERLLQRSPGR